MVYRYDLGNKCLYTDDIFLPSADYEMNEIGSCFKCSGHLKSLSAHVQDAALPDQKKHLLVSVCTKCVSVYVNIYDKEWSWIDDAEPETFKSDKIAASKIIRIPVYNDIINTLEELEKIPEEQLKAVFSSTEIQAIFHKARHEKNIRQYYHRARLKYEKFEEVFGIRINI